MQLMSENGNVLSSTFLTHNAAAAHARLYHQKKR